MTTKSQLSTTEPKKNKNKNEISKQLYTDRITEMVEYGHKIEEKVKPMKSGIKENAPRTNCDGKKTGTQINSLEQR